MKLPSDVLESRKEIKLLVVWKEALQMYVPPGNFWLLAHISQEKASCSDSHVVHLLIQKEKTINKKSKLGVCSKPLLSK